MPVPLLWAKHPWGQVASSLYWSISDKSWQRKMEQKINSLLNLFKAMDQCLSGRWRGRGGVAVGGGGVQLEVKLLELPFIYFKSRYSAGLLYWEVSNPTGANIKSIPVIYGAYKTVPVFLVGEVKIYCGTMHLLRCWGMSINAKWIFIWTEKKYWVKQ